MLDGEHGAAENRHENYISMAHYSSKVHTQNTLNIPILLIIIIIIIIMISIMSHQDTDEFICAQF